MLRTGFLFASPTRTGSNSVASICASGNWVVLDAHEHRCLCRSADVADAAAFCLTASTSASEHWPRLLSDEAVLSGPTVLDEVKIYTLAGGDQVEIGSMHLDLVIDRNSQRSDLASGRDDAGTTEHSLAILQPGLGRGSDPERIGNSSPPVPADGKRWARTQNSPYALTSTPPLPNGQRTLLFDIPRGTLSATS